MLFPHQLLLLMTRSQIQGGHHYTPSSGFDTSLKEGKKRKNYSSD